MYSNSIGNDDGVPVHFLNPNTQLQNLNLDRTNRKNCALLPRGLNPGPRDDTTGNSPRHHGSVAMAGLVYWSSHMVLITNQPIMRRQAVCAVVFVCDVVWLGLTHNSISQMN